MTDEYVLNVQAELVGEEHPRQPMPEGALLMTGGHEHVYATADFFCIDQWIVSPRAQRKGFKSIMKRSSRSRRRRRPGVRLRSSAPTSAASRSKG